MTANDPEWWRCEGHDGALRCVRAGAISPSGRGGGPWFCYEHYRRITKPSANATGPTGGFRHLREVVAEVAPKRDDEADAERAAIQGEAPAEFCRDCGAGIGAFRREGEGTCPKCVTA